MAKQKRLPPLCPELEVLLRRAAQGCSRASLLAIRRAILHAPDAHRGRTRTEVPSRQSTGFARDQATEAGHHLLESHQAAFKSSALLSCTTVPFLGSERWAEAAARVTAFVGLVSSPVPAGAWLGSQARVRLRLLATPCLWALVGTHPETQVTGPPPVRAARIGLALAVIDLFGALSRCSDWPASVLLPAGALAAFAGPPSAGNWVRLALHAAQGCGARRLERFFHAVVTQASRDPSFE